MGNNEFFAGWTLLDKKLVWGLFVILALVAPVTNAVDLKIGYVNAARLLEEAPQAELATKRLKQEFAPREESLVTTQKVISDAEEKLRQEADIMSEGQRRAAERDLMQQKRDARRIQDEFRDDLNFRRNEELGKLQALVKQIIETVGKDEKFDLILFEGIAFANDKVDITDKILERLTAEAKNADAARGPK